MSWLPIETAPRDGTPVLVWPVYCDGFGPLAITGYWQESKHPGWTDTIEGAFGLNPTHRMPLPAPPTTN